MKDMIAKAIVAIGLHELAHVAAARTVGVRVYEMRMSWKGPFIRRDPGTTGQNLAITIAGPGINLLLALGLYRISPGFALCNLVLGVCNLLPFASSDGSRALNLLATMRQNEAPLSINSHARAGGEPTIVNGGDQHGRVA